MDPHRIKRLTAGDSYVEDVASSRLRAVLDTGAYSATADDAALAGFDIAVITVPTPLRDGVADPTYIESCARPLGEHLRPGATVVLESTTYPGTTEELLLPILEKTSGLKGGVDYLAGFSPERYRSGKQAVVVRRDAPADHQSDAAWLALAMRHLLALEAGLHSFPYVQEE
ncbi:hypothetical protein OG304_06430 [Streptomyces sp. NBC_00160]|uniref:hypothetical protein n=1 Tax=Streptomyces sp. NBC_00160 TaxID=2903628 RepID=UPI00224DF6F5|nr:hypothetical protein [Streptomyces sp. NBC_00160]MCX5303089.1 hypothetical protein [Streptomyces sp. NBC_00160]